MLGSSFPSILLVAIKTCVLHIVPVQGIFPPSFCMFILVFKNFLLPSLPPSFFPLPSPASFAASYISFVDFILLTTGFEFSLFSLRVMWITLSFLFWLHEQNKTELQLIFFLATAKHEERE